MKTPLFPLGVAALSVLLSACSSAGKAQSSGTTGSGGAHGSTTGAGNGTGTASDTTSSLTFPIGTTTTGGTGPEDAGSDAAPFTPTMFDCQGCSCDGATHYCMTALGGAPVPPPGSPPGPPGPPMPSCPDDAQATGCLPLPAACVSQPSCACVGPMVPCSCTTAAGGVSVTCAYP